MTDSEASYEDLPARPYEAKFSADQVELHPSERLFLVRSGENLSIFDAFDGTLRYRHDVPEGPLVARFSPDGNVVVVGTMDNRAYLVDFRRDGRRGKTPKMADYVDEIAWIGDSRFFVATSQQNDTTVFDSASMEPARTIRSADRKLASFYGMAVSRDGTRIFLSNETVFTAHDGITGAVLWSRPAASASGKIAVSPDGSVLAVADTRGFVLLDAQNGDRLFGHPFARRGIRFPGMAGLGTVWSPAPAFSPNGALIATNTPTGDLLLIDARTGNARPLANRCPGLAWIESLAWFRDGRRLLVGCSDDRCCIWDVETQGLVLETPAYSEATPTSPPIDPITTVSPKASVPSASPVSSDPSVCAQCGAPRTTVLCSYCGALAAPPEDYAAEAQALKLFSELIAVSTDEAKGRLLQTGFLPGHPALLIEAGILCMPLIHEEKTDEEPAESAFLRLGAVASKLRLLPATPEATRALVEFEKKLEAFRNAKRTVARIAIGLVSAIVLIVLVIVWRVFFV
jgi:WD40 repeat protein